MTEAETSSVIDLTTAIVASYVTNNPTRPADLPDLIHAVQRALAGLGEPEPVLDERKPPAVSVRRSITPDYLVCLEDGRHFKTLKRHLRTSYGLTPDAYRARWGLPADYPMVAPNYADTRSRLARAAGLGQAGRSVATTQTQSVKPRGRPRKSPA